MSNCALTWAWKQKTGSSSRKSVLISMADRASEDFICYPSIKRIMLDTELSRNTIIKVIDELEELGFIRWTGETRGTGVKVYQIIGVIGREDDTQSSTNFGTPTSTNFDTSNKNATSTNFDKSSTNFGTPTSTNFDKSSTNFGTQNHQNHHKNHKEPKESVTHAPKNQNSKNPKNPKSDNPTDKTITAQKPTTAKKFITADELIALGVDLQVAQDFLATRKTKLTQTALNGIIRQSAEAGLTVARAIEFACEMGWQSFKADWYANSQKPYSSQLGGQPKEREEGSYLEFLQKIQKENKAFARKHGL